MNIREWEILSLDKQKVVNIAQKYDVPDIVAMLLQLRNFEDCAHDMLYKTQWDKDPFEFIDMDKAVERINRAVDDFEKIAVYGDYDADGVTSTAIVYSHLNTVGADVMYYIPERDGEGYGMNIPAIEELSRQGVKLIVTVDNGIASVEEVKRANELGIDVVITDHHRPQDVIPDAYAVVDPYRKDCPSKFKDYAGAGVALKLVMALVWDIEMSGELFDLYCDLATIGTIGDVVPLVDENRILVKNGLNSIYHSHRPGVTNLVEASAMKKISATSLAFTIVPRINAAGRMGCADKALNLLTCEDEDDALMLCDIICKENEVRKTTQEEVYIKAIEIIENDEIIKNSRIIVVGGENWHHGVLGIVSAKITQKYGKPSLVLSIDDGEAKGSGRSVEGVSLFEALSSCKDVLTKFGGHPMAAGLSLNEENIDNLRSRINEFCKEKYEYMPSPKTVLDCKLMPVALNPKLVEDIEFLEPFGTGNLTPKFGLFSMTLEKIVPVSGGKHLRLHFIRDGVSISAMMFSKTPEDFLYTEGTVLDLAVCLDVNEFRGAKNLTIIINDIKPSKLDIGMSLKTYKIYENILRKEKLSDKQKCEILPTREDFALLYRAIKSNSKTKSLLVFVTELNTINLGKLLFMIDVLKERKLICVNGQNVENLQNISILPTSGKVDIFASPLFENI